MKRTRLIVANMDKFHSDALILGFQETEDSCLTLEQDDFCFKLMDSRRQEMTGMQIICQQLLSANLLVTEVCILLSTDRDERFLNLLRDIFAASTTNNYRIFVILTSAYYQSGLVRQIEEIVNAQELLICPVCVMMSKSVQR